jgi:hypothetical protein
VTRPRIALSAELMGKRRFKTIQDFDKFIAKFLDASSAAVSPSASRDIKVLHNASSTDIAS